MIRFLNCCYPKLVLQRVSSESSILFVGMNPSVFVDAPSRRYRSKSESGFAPGTITETAEAYATYTVPLSSPNENPVSEDFRTTPSAWSVFQKRKDSSRRETGNKGGFGKEPVFRRDGFGYGSSGGSSGSEWGVFEIAVVWRRIKVISEKNRFVQRN